jgi:hypothetical protein
LETYLDFLCPFSKRIYLRLRDEVLPHYSSKGVALELVFHQAPQPWHPQGSQLHETALAVQLLRPDAYKAAFDALFDASDSFKDEPTWRMTRPEIYEALARAVAPKTAVDEKELLALLTPDFSKGYSNGVTHLLKLCCKHHRQRGIHVTPTCATNGIVADTSSGWTLEQWTAYLDPCIV